MKIKAALALTLGFVLGVGNAQAQVLIGQTVGVTGTVAATVKESMLGAQMYFDHINARGGVFGDKIQVITLDDKFDTALTLVNAKILI